MSGPVDGVELGFQIGVIDDGADAAAAAAAAAVPVIDRLAGMVIAPGQFGRVAPAEAVASGLGAARDGFRDLALRVQQRHADLASRARSTAAAGEQLVTDTSQAATAGTPR